MMFILDAIIAILLICTIVYCHKLNRKIMDMHDGRKDLVQLIKSFDDAILRAEKTVHALKAEGKKAGSTLREAITGAKYLSDDLSYMTKRGQNLVQLLEQNIDPAQKTSKAPILNQSTQKKAAGSLETLLTQITQSTRANHQEKRKRA